MTTKKFTRQDIHKKPRLSDVWRKPRGLQSKQRLQHKGHTPIVKTGYGAPASVRGKHKSNLIPVLVSNISELSKVKVETEGIMISGNVGKKKKIEIIKKGVELKLTFINVKKPEEFLKEIEKEIEQKKQQKKVKADIKDKKKKELEKKVEEKKKEEEKKEKEEKEQPKDEDLEKKEKKEMDKVLTKKET